MCRVRFSSKRGRGYTHGGEGRRGLRRGRKEREEGTVVHGSVMIYTRPISCPRRAPSVAAQHPLATCLTVPVLSKPALFLFGPR